MKYACCSNRCICVHTCMYTQESHYLKIYKYILDIAIFLRLIKNHDMTHSINTFCCCFLQRNHAWCFKLVSLVTAKQFSNHKTYQLNFITMLSAFVLIFMHPLVLCLVINKELYLKTLIVDRLLQIIQILTSI